MQVQPIIAPASKAQTPPTVTTPKACAAIARAHENCFVVVVEPDNWLVLKKGRREAAAIDLAEVTWVEDLHAFLSAWDLVDLAKHGELSARHWHPKALHIVR